MLKWIEVISNMTTHKHKLLYQLDYGERNVILNALKLKADLVLVDDRIARNIAEYMGLHVKGTLDSPSLKTNQWTRKTSQKEGFKNESKCNY